MKKNLLQTVTMCLCLILLIITLMQGKMLEEFQFEMESQMQSLDDSLSNQIQNITWQIESELEEANQLVTEYTMEPAGIDSENHALAADVTVNLKQWYADTEVILLAGNQGEESEILMEGDGQGGFSARVTFPLEDDTGITLTALISGGGVTTQETLEYLADLSILLPLCYSGSGWTGPVYQAGTLSSSFSINIENRNGDIANVNDPEFHIYRNGELAEILPAIPDPYGDPGSFRPNTPDNDWKMECAFGDMIEVFFRCEDEFGLGYEFPFQAWLVDAETDDGQVSGMDISTGWDVKLFWPE